jgi:hypothetical protein
MTITPFLKNQALGPEVIQAMGVAFQNACRRLRLSVTAGDQAAELVASKIIDLAQRGERDPDVLYRRTLAEFDLDP